MADKKLDYTDRDFVAIRDAMLASIPFYTPEWTDRSPDDFGVVLLELFAGSLDVMHWYADRLANENFLATAVSRPAIIRLVNMLGVQLQGVEAAKTNVTFSINTPLGYDLVIPAGTKIATSALAEQVVFETDDEVTILTGQTTSPSVGATQGETVTENLGLSDGSQFQRFTLAQKPVLEDSIRIYVDLVEWLRVDSLVLVGSTDRRWQLEKDADDNITILFGDGSTGKIPDPSAAITTAYRVGGGTQGNLGIGLINNVLDAFPVTVNVTNTSEATGGAARETAEEARFRAPATFKTLDRAVPLEDYSVLAQNVPGVAKAQALVIGPARVGLYVAPNGGGIPSPSLLADVLDYLESRRMATDGIEAFAPSYDAIDADCVVTILPEYRNSVISTQAEDLIDEYFDVANREFGQPDSPKGDVKISDLFALLESIEGVDFVEFAKLTLVVVPVWKVATGDAAFSTVPFPSLTTIAETWTVIFITATTFSVRGSLSGLQIASGTLGVPYISDNGEVAFQIDAGATPMADGDYAEFRISPLVGTIKILPTEMAERGTFNITVTGGLP